MRMFRNFLNFKVSNLIRSVQPSPLFLGSRYCQITRSCWNCHASLEGNENFIFCSKCQAIQKTPKVVSKIRLIRCNFIKEEMFFQDYFELFGIQRDPKVNMKDLTRRFRNIQSEIHPDKFSTKTEREQNLSSDWSSLVNKAYNILKAPLARGEYLLKLNGFRLPEDNTIQDSEFLMEMMERNEKV